MSFRRKPRQPEPTPQTDPLASPHPFSEPPDHGGPIPDGSRHFGNGGLVDDEHSAAPDDGTVSFSFGDDPEPAADTGVVDYGRVFGAEHSEETTP